MKKVNKVLALFLCAVIFMGLAGCASSGENAQSSDTGLIEKATRLLQAEGREYDKLYTAKMNELLTNAFFEFSIRSATIASELEGYVPQTEGYQFLVADVLVKNVFGDTIPVGNYDFDIYWNGGGDVAYESFFDEMYPDEMDLADGESIRGKLVYEIPADATDIMIGYTEIWDDDFEGNMYLVEIEPDAAAPQEAENDV